MAAEDIGLLQVVDPHIHLWDRMAVRYPWLDNPGVAYSGDNRLLPETYGVPALLQDAAGIDLRMSVHVEANPADPLAEAVWLQSLCADPANRGHPHGIVAYADLSAEGVGGLIGQLAAIKNLRGIRQILNVHADPRYDYVGRHFMREPAWRRNIALLARFGWSFDLQLYPAQVADALPIIDANPDITFIVNHAGMFVDRGSVRGWREWREGLQALAARGNVAIKLSGLAMFDHHWSIESFRPYVLQAIDDFGPARCMFASNFPIDGLHADYGRLWQTYAGIVAGATPAERAGLFAGNALRYYRLAEG